VPKAQPPRAQRHCRAPLKATVGLGNGAGDPALDRVSRLTPLEGAAPDASRSGEEEFFKLTGQRTPRVGRKPVVYRLRKTPSLA
jgi:hypothetical protein